MKKLTLFLCIFGALPTMAQDRILTLKRDTLIAKVSSIDKQRIIYILDGDESKKPNELSINSLHKIIWRSGLEYVINKEFDEELKKQFPIPIADKKISPLSEKQPISIINTETNISKTPQTEEIINYPELRVRHWVLWRTYTADGKRVSPNKMEGILYKYDLETYGVFERGNALRLAGRKSYWIGSGLNIVGNLAFGYLPLLYLASNTAGFTLQVIGIVKYYKGRRLMREAIYMYEDKKDANLIRSRFKNMK